MNVEPMRINVDPKKPSRPVNILSPYSTPVYIRDAVFQQLQSMVRMGIIESVPIGELSPWCAPMMTVLKKTGDPCLVTNFWGLNKVCDRAPHPTQDTFRQVLSIP